MVKRASARKVSMSDVASAAGVSKTTVSRYLHGEYGYMSTQTKDKLESVIHELGYRPNKMAQGLKATHSRMLGVVIANIGNPFSSQLLKGIQQECRERGLQLLVSDSDDKADLERSNIEALLDVQVDGLIVNPVGNNEQYFLTYARLDDAKPIVMLDRTIQNERVEQALFDSVVSDNARGVYDMMEHVRSQGYAHVVFVTHTYDGISTRVARVEAFNHALDEMSSSLTGEVLTYSADLEDLKEKIQTICTQHDAQSVCFFANNEETVMEILTVMPSEFSHLYGLSAFAQESWARFSGPGITCLDQSPVYMGKKAAEILCERVYGQSSEGKKTIEIPVKLYEFDSTRAQKDI